MARDFQDFGDAPFQSGETRRFLEVEQMCVEKREGWSNGPLGLNYFFELVDPCCLPTWKPGST